MYIQAFFTAAMINPRKTCQKCDVYGGIEVTFDVNILFMRAHKTFTYYFFCAHFNVLLGYVSLFMW